MPGFSLIYIIKTLGLDKSVGAHGGEPREVSKGTRKLQALHLLW